jgi:hypothetical protein
MAAASAPMVGVLGLLLVVTVQTAGVQDREEATPVLRGLVTRSPGVHLLLTGVATAISLT